MTLNDLKFKDYEINILNDENASDDEKIRVMKNAKNRYYRKKSGLYSQYEKNYYMKLLKRYRDERN